MLAASKNAAAGEFLFDTGAATAWLANRAREDFMGAVSALTEQEGELLRLLVAGHTDSQIALRMRLDEKAFRTCLLALISKARTPRDVDQIVNTAAALRHMSGGQFSVPLVVRMATGAGRQLAAQHSHSLEPWYAHIPGIKVVSPATVEDAYGMLGPALADPDPVVIFEHVQLYNTSADIDSLAPTDISRAAIRRSGTDATVVAYGGSLSKALDAANELSLTGIDCEVVDLRVLRPLDTDTILESVRKTHRAVVIDEAWRSGSLAAEITARVMEGAFYDLDAPVARVCSAEVPMPYAKHLEQAALPQTAKIVAAVRNLFGDRQ